MVVGGLGPEPQPALQTQGQKCIPWLCSSLICALRRGGSPGPWAREELQERWGGAEASSVWGEIWGEGYCHGLHAHIHVNSPEKYTHTHKRHESLREEPDNKATITQLLGQTKFKCFISLWKYLMLIVNAFQELLQHMCMFAMESQSFYWIKRKKERCLWKESKSSIMRNSLGRA